MRHAFLDISSRFAKDVNTRQQFSFSFPELRYSPLEFNSEKFAIICRIEQDGINAMKFEVARILSLNDIFVAVAVLVA